MQKNNDSSVPESSNLYKATASAINNYLNTIENYDLSKLNLHKLVINQVEMAIFSTVLQYTKGNKTNASLLLGISRTTIKKKIQEHNIKL